MSDTAAKMQLMQDPSSCHVMNMSKISMLTIVSKRSVVNRLPSIKFIVGILAVVLCVQCHAAGQDSKPKKRRWWFQSHKNTNAETYGAVHAKGEAKMSRYKFMFGNISSSVWRLCAILTLLTLIAVVVPGKAEGNLLGCGGNGEAVGGSSLFMRLAVMIPSLVFIGIAAKISYGRYSKMKECQDVTEYNNWVQGNDGSESLCKRHSTTTSMAVWFLIILAMGLGALAVGLTENASALPDYDTPFMQTPMFLITMISLLTVGGVGLSTSLRMLYKYNKAITPADVDGGIKHTDTPWPSKGRRFDGRRLAHLVEAIDAQY